jgi:tetratricopeptide (TPR) repeat protein
VSPLVALLLAVVPQDGALQERAPVLDRSPSEWAAAEESRWAGWDPSKPAPPRVEARGALNRALESVRRGDLVVALGGWFDLLEVEPEYPPALYQAGVIYFRLRRYSDAATAFERYLKIAPQRVGDTRALGHCHYSLGRYSQAAQHYEQVLEQGETPGVRFGLALARMRLGEEDAALMNLERVVELDARHVEAHTWLGQLHFDAGRAADARAALEHAQALDPFAPRPWFLFSRVLLEEGEEEAGSEAHQRFKSLEGVAQEVRSLEGKLLYSPSQPAVHRRLVELHASAGDIGRVMGTLRRWEALDPEGLQARVAGLEAWRSLGRRGEAASAALGLAEVAGDSIEAWAALARHYRATRERVLQVQAEERWRALRAAAPPASKD